MSGATSGDKWDDLSEDFDLRPELAHLAGDIDSIELTPEQITAEMKFQRRKRRKRGFGFNVDRPVD